MEITELKNAMSGIKTSLDELNSRTEEIISELEGRSVKIIQSDKRGEKY